MFSNASRRVRTRLRARSSESSRLASVLTSECLCVSGLGGLVGHSVGCAWPSDQVAKSSVRQASPVSSVKACLTPQAAGLRTLGRDRVLVTVKHARCGRAENAWAHTHARDGSQNLAVLALRTLEAHRHDLLSFLCFWPAGAEDMTLSWAGGELDRPCHRQTWH